MGIKQILLKQESKFQVQGNIICQVYGIVIDQLKDKNDFFSNNDFKNKRKICIKYHQLDNLHHSIKYQDFTSGNIEFLLNTFEFKIIFHLFEKSFRHITENFPSLHLFYSVDFKYDFFKSQNQSHKHKSLFYVSYQEAICFESLYRMLTVMFC